MLDAAHFVSAVFIQNLLYLVVPCITEECQMKAVVHDFA